MELVMQPAFTTCGQACIAMITGKDIEEVIKDMKTSGSEFGVIDGEYTCGKITSFLGIYQ